MPHAPSKMFCAPRSPKVAVSVDQSASVIVPGNRVSFLANWTAVNSSGLSCESSSFMASNFAGSTPARRNPTRVWSVRYRQPFEVATTNVTDPRIVHGRGDGVLDAIPLSAHNASGRLADQSIVLSEFGRYIPYALIRFSLRRALRIRK
jgi:hypothetical protein